MEKIYLFLVFLPIIEIVRLIVFIEIGRVQIKSSLKLSPISIVCGGECVILLLIRQSTSG